MQSLGNQLVHLHGDVTTFHSAVRRAGPELLSRGQRLDAASPAGQEQGRGGRQQPQMRTATGTTGLPSQGPPYVGRLP